MMGKKKFTPAQAEALLALQRLSNGDAPNYRNLQHEVFRMSGEYLHSQQLTGLARRGYVGYRLTNKGQLAAIAVAAVEWVDYMAMDSFPTTDEEVEKFISDPSNKAELPESLKDPLRIIELAEKGKGPDDTP